MPRRIVSQDPITRDSRAQKTYGDMKMVLFRTMWDGNKTRLRVHLKNYDETTGELDPEGQDHVISLDNFDEQISISPKLSAAWNAINDVMGLVYDFYRLRDKVKEAREANQDPSALIAARNAALAALRAGVR